MIRSDIRRQLELIAMAKESRAANVKKSNPRIVADDPAVAEPKPGDRCFCAQPPVTPIVLPPDIRTDRAYAIYSNNKRWVSTTTLHYCFVERASNPSWSWSETEKDVVRDAFQEWKRVGIGLDFVEVERPGDAEIKIGNYHNNESWSYVGTDCLRNEDLGRTMNFGWDVRTRWGRATALHEIGHALGLEHEHQNPNSGIVWNEEEVIRVFSGEPNNWKLPGIQHNILNKLQGISLRGSSWRPQSIMHYEFTAAMIRHPAPYNATGIAATYNLDSSDKTVILEAYPSLRRRNIQVMRMEALPAEIGAQAAFTFVPEDTRVYRIQTVGQSDMRVVVFEERDGEPRHHISEDDSGADANLMIETKLIAGRPYVISTRTNFVDSRDGVGLLIS
ncbi:matrixin family metalloprotease [Methylobacterium sp. NPDC080182]|uniref:matrixin family metalloprotease n=1 Tax=Methylobacterium sp. NPDC080182 TaxID=3390590 RepID=UPI003D02C855